MYIGKREVRRVRLDSRYSVSEDGLVWSGELPLTAVGGVGVNLHGKRVKVAYLVARAFVPNGEMRRWVRHKNGDVTDNRAENLEWCDEKEEGRRGRREVKCWIQAWRKSGDTAGVFYGVEEASRETGVAPAAIRSCLRGKQKFAGELIWRKLGE